MAEQLKYLIREKDRHGNTRIYYRKKPGPRIRIRAEEGTPEFLIAYRLAQAGLEADGSRIEPEKRPAPLSGPIPGTLRHMIAEYYRSPEFRGLNIRTQRVRRLILDKLCRAGAEGGKKPYGDRSAIEMEPRHVRLMRDENADRPEAANGIIKALRRVFDYALDAEYPGLRTNPARLVRYLKSKGDGHHSWTMEEVEQFERCFPIGTRQRLALALLLYTGQRRSDIVQLGPKNVRHGWLTFTQAKGKDRKPITLTIPIIPELQRIIDATPGVIHEAFLTTAFGKPFSAAGFGNWFGDSCRKAGVPGTAHGLRKATSARLAELGCSDREIMAITGHTTSKEVDRYTKGARQKILAASAMAKLSGGEFKPQLALVAGRT